MTTGIQPRPVFTGILVPLDGSRLAEAVLASAARIAVACQARLTLLHVHEHSAPTTVHGERHLVDLAAAETYLHTVAERLIAQYPSLDVDQHVHPNEEHDIARSIAAHARELGTDLIALTTHGSSGLRGLLAGSIAQQTLRLSEAPVLVVRPIGADADRAGPILVALDGGPQAEAALPTAVMLALALPAPLHLVRVVRTVSSERGAGAAVATFTPAASAGLLDLEEADARQYLARVITTLPAEVSVSGEVRRGDPAEEIVKATHETRAGLVVVATHGKTGIESLLQGSVIPQVLTRLATPMLLIRLAGPSATN